MADIYALIDENGDIRYIGKANNPSARLMGHMRETRRRRTPLYDWLRKHGCPALIVLESDCADWKASEREWIAAGREASAPLLNMADGGDEPHCPTSVRAENARKTARALMDDPRRKAIRDRKAMIMRTLRSFEREGHTERAARVRARMHRAAAERPDIFAEWAHV